MPHSFKIVFSSLLFMISFYLPPLMYALVLERPNIAISCRVTVALKKSLGPAVAAVIRLATAARPFLASILQLPLSRLESGKQTTIQLYSIHMLYHIAQFNHYFNTQIFSVDKNKNRKKMQRDFLGGKKNHTFNYIQAICSYRAQFSIYSITQIFLSEKQVRKC